MMFIIGTGSTGAVTRARCQVPTAASPFRGRHGMRIRQRHAEQRVGAEAALVLGAVEVDQAAVEAFWSAASKPSSADRRVVDVRHGLAARPCRGSASCRHRAVQPLPWCRWTRPTAPRAAEAGRIGQRDFRFERGIAAAVEDFAGVDVD
jgi:hypothetical protein